MKRTLGVLALVCAGWASAAGAAPRSNACHRFIVGRANSTAYPHGRLPARGTAVGASCATLRRIARRLNNGTYPIPLNAGAHAPHYGRPFAVHDQGRKWSCRFQAIGGSGPTYAIKCRRGDARLAWHVG